jgi:hypothetical protein
MGVKGKPEIIDIMEKKNYNGMATSEGWQRREYRNYGLDTTRREGQEDVQEKRGWKEYKQS